MVMLKATVYLLDDGHDPAKKEWVQQLDSPRLKYVMRTKPAGEVKGKAGNLNHALRMIYPCAADAIPLTEARLCSHVLAPLLLFRQKVICVEPSSIIDTGGARPAWVTCIVCM